jgi:hypothetical protein
VRSITSRGTFSERWPKRTCCTQVGREALFDGEMSTFDQARPGIDHGRGVEFAL